MALASTLTPQDIIDQDLRISNATPEDVAFYDRAAYRRIEQLTKGDQDTLLTDTLLPKASIELLIALEVSWWPMYAANHGLPKTKKVDGKTVSAFDPAKLIKQGQPLIELEVFKASEMFYATIVTDNANLNEKDAENHKFAAKRFSEAWTKVTSESAFYDDDGDDVIDSTEEDEVDEDMYSGDRRYF